MSIENLSQELHKISIAPIIIPAIKLAIPKYLNNIENVKITTPEEIKKILKFFFDNEVFKTNNMKNIRVIAENLDDNEFNLLENEQKLQRYFEISDEYFKMENNNKIPNRIYIGWVACFLRHTKYHQLLQAQLNKKFNYTNIKPTTRMQNFQSNYQILLDSNSFNNFDKNTINNFEFNEIKQIWRLPNNSWWACNFILKYIDYNILSNNDTKEIIEKYLIFKDFFIENNIYKKGLEKIIIRLSKEADYPKYEPLLKDAIQEFGNPISPKNAHYWQFSDQGKGLIKKWFISEGIQKFFTLLADDSGDPRRARFWQEWVDYIDDIQFFMGKNTALRGDSEIKRIIKDYGEYNLRDKTNAFAMVIGNIKIIEFSDSGNAAYIYDKNFETTNQKFFKIDELKRKGAAKDRICHNIDWEKTANEIIIKFTQLNAKKTINMINANKPMQPISQNFSYNSTPQITESKIISLNKINDSGVDILDNIEIPKPIENSNSQKSWQLIEADNDILEVKKPPHQLQNIWQRIWSKN